MFLSVDHDYRCYIGMADDLFSRMFRNLPKWHPG